MPKNVAVALWRKKDGGARPRVTVAALAAVVALAAPAVGRAADIPSQLLSQAQANPDQTFNVIIQTGDSSQPPAAVAQQALTKSSQRDFAKAQAAANDASRKLNDATKRAADAAARVADAQRRLDDAISHAAQTGNPADQAEVTRKQGDLAKAQADLKAAQDALAAAQSAAALAQLALVQQQARYSASFTQAANDIDEQYSIIPAVSASVQGSDIVGMSTSSDVLSVTPDTPVALMANNNSQGWVDAAGVRAFWAAPQRRQAASRTPTIAIVDSGVDGSRVSDFGGRLLGQVNLTSLAPNSPGDGRGHGTMVASIAAGASDRYSGADPDAPIISLDVLNDNGEGRTSDVIAAADWILANRLTYNIRVANFSLDSAVESSFGSDPLAKAVEQLWFNGVVVVAAAGNYAVNGTASGVHFAPASDPFVITVGALDIGNNNGTGNDVAAPWSAWGYTNDGFMKPEISAPGRYMIGACPPAATLCRTGGQDPRLVKQGYLELSGTSFAAPIVSGAAAAILALHPDWTPDQVKGELMLTATPLPKAVPGSVGVGEVDMKDAVFPGPKLASTPPPNPNLALESFLVQQPNGGLVFDAASWASAAQGNASWNSASWSSASWASASWASASWNSASWASASWSSASWASASWSSASWASSASGLAFADNARLDGAGNG